LSINISPYALVASDVLTALTKEIVYHSIPYRSLIVEITETSIEQSPEEMSRISACLEMLGINISIDDFGTGQSSLLYIKHMPIKELKIDKTFVMNMLSNPADESIVRSTIELAHSLGCEAVAEGVESTDVLDKLSELGCDTVQGYLVSRPLPEADFLEFLEERNGNKKTAR
jgi:EAL domain-containing protein (putative c-di-GMP-specific phosphodiesterase class I)